MFSGLFGNSKATSVSFGANLPVGSKALSAEINDVGEKFSKTNKKYRDEIDKYKKIADFNKKLSSSYIANIHAMVDVSKLLNDYALFFNLLKEEIAKTESQIGTLKTEDIQYLESLTKAKMDDFSSKFLSESDKVKILYSKYGQEQEVKNIITAQEAIKTTVGDATTTYKSLTEQQGGKKKEIKKVNKKPTKKDLKTKR